MLVHFWWTMNLKISIPTLRYYYCFIYSDKTGDSLCCFVTMLASRLTSSRPLVARINFLITWRIKITRWFLILHEVRHGGLRSKKSLKSYDAEQRKKSMKIIFSLVKCFNNNNATVTFVSNLECMTMVWNEWNWKLQKTDKITCGENHQNRHRQPTAENGLKWKLKTNAETVNMKNKKKICEMWRHQRWRNWVKKTIFSSVLRIVKKMKNLWCAKDKFSKSNSVILLLLTG